MCRHSSHISGDKPRISMPSHNNRTRITKDFRSATCTRDESQHCVIRRVAISPPAPALCVEHGFINKGSFYLLWLLKTYGTRAQVAAVVVTMITAEIRSAKCHMVPMVFYSWSRYVFNIRLGGTINLTVFILF